MATKPKSTEALDAFFKAVEQRTSDPIHLRLLAAARRKDPSGSLERELDRILQELTNET